MVRVVRDASIRGTVYDFWADSPHVTASEICEKLELNYETHGNYVNKLLSEFRNQHCFGSAQEALKYPHRRVFTWKCVPRRDSDVKEALRCGWVKVENRNKMLIFRGFSGSVHWFKGGRVMLFLRGEVQLARAKELFCRAFSWFDPIFWRKFLDVPLHEETREWVFDVRKPLPSFDVRHFEHSHGIRIFVDKSHATALEVRETVPFWLHELDDATSSFRKVTQEFGREIQEHLTLIREWQQEAKAQRQPKPDCHLAVCLGEKKAERICGKSACPD